MRIKHVNNLKGAMKALRDHDAAVMTPRNGRVPVFFANETLMSAAKKQLGGLGMIEQGG